ncbi:extracellular solute-binding protein [Alicyclobacillus fastidiosus]|uniref:Extracellular solute-binding protein n=1 Tax=Alicyclobacillus fastidiosus TaxID=392011 RepID=A0ABY6ZKD3_9BACL|nr:extracellular solute-binding protein [Alicyclobacillus fastidiosus]WAH43388.1 extracellular solute-binding protein [Alicyclobacillus fastidiosus]GMA65454.1 ABC transporter substrate-binding protein [Alicyclobacillus fastidiosus]
MINKLGNTTKVLGITAASVIFLAGCEAVQTASGSSDASSSSSKSASGVTDITFWNGHPSGDLQTQMHSEVAQFNKTHPDIHVSYVDKYTEVQPITAAFAAHDAPNVGMPHVADAEQFEKDGYLVDLTPFMSNKSAIQSDYYPNVWNSVNITPGQTYLLPYEESAQMVIYYNQNLLKQAGITQAPKTWNDLVSDAEKITTLGNGDHGIAWTPSLTQFFVMAEDFGGSVFASSGDTKFALNNSGANKALTMLRQMVVNKSLLITQNYNYQLDFGTGKVGVLMDASAGFTYDNGSAGGKFKMVATPAPVGNSGQQYNFVDGDALCVFNTGTKAQQQAAYTFIKWLASPSTNAEWNESTNYVPTGPASDKLMQSFYKTNTNYAASFSAPNNWMTEPSQNTAAYEAATTAMDSDFEKALLGQESVSTALQNMTTIGNEYLSGKKQG